jgi:acyl-CoA thioester hydrolase
MKTVSFELPIYTYQIDFVGHVSNIVYVQWMEIGRHRLLQDMELPIERIAQEGVVPVLVHTEIDYLDPLFLGDQVRVEIWLSELRHASAQIEFRFYKNLDTLAASGSQRGLFIHRKTMRPYRMPIEMREAFEPYLAASPSGVA